MIPQQQLHDIHVLPAEPGGERQIVKGVEEGPDAAVHFAQREVLAEAVPRAPAKGDEVPLAEAHLFFRADPAGRVKDVW